MEELQRKVVEVMNSIGSIHMGNVDRGAATQRIVAHMRREFPKHNVMVVHTQHMQSFEECAHSHIELKTGWIGTTGFEIYVFKRGNFTLLGDGGYINWAFGGNFQRDGATVKFFNL